MAVLGAAIALAPAIAGAHELRPGLLEIEVAADGVAELRLRLPPRPLAASLPEVVPVLAGCELVPFVDPRADADDRRWRGRCADGGPAAIELRGLAEAGHDVVVDLRRGDGDRSAPPFTALLRPAAPRIDLGPAARPGLLGYLALGVEHILGGLDHLLFVVGLVVLVRQRAATTRRAALRSAAALTGFTVAHSLTLAAATLGLVTLAAAPVEACIALTLVLLARSIVADAPPTSLWAFACACGLLHGLGFAGALAELGLPEDAIVPALLAFNGGVELGQIAAAAAVLGALALVPARWRARWIPAIVGTAIGGIATAMLLGRVLAL